MKRKISYLLTFIFVAFTAVFAVACNKGGAAKAEVLSSTENQLVIRVHTTEGNATLTDVMTALQEEGELSFTVTGGMVTAINGKSNTASDFWMLYTSDTEMSNTEWGTVDYEGERYASAVLGADTLTVVDGGLYIWDYQSF